jgi:hypothetical protein
MFHHTKGACDAAPCPMADDESPGGVGREDRGLGQAPAPMGDAAAQALAHCARPLVRALAREKATSYNMHPNVLAQVEETDAGNK